MFHVVTILLVEEAEHCSQLQALPEGSLLDQEKFVLYEHRVWASAA